MFIFAALTALLLSIATASPACSISGEYFLEGTPSVTVRIDASDAGGAVAYVGTCTSGNCGWVLVNITIDVARPWSAALQLDFDNGAHEGAWALAPCDASGQRVLFFNGGEVYHMPWCDARNAACSVPLDPFWAGGEVHLIEVSHSDIFWLGAQNDVLIDAANINASLALMASNPDFAWQHECILFLRAYVDMYGPEAEAALVARMAEGRFDIGGTFSEGFESTMLNEVLARQAYTGRKWLLDRYPSLADTGVVAFHQDGPLRGLQTAQVYAKAGLRYLKPSRLSEDIVAWASPDGSSLLAFPQWQYCEGASQWATDARDILFRLALFAPQYAAAGLPRVLPVTWGCDYAPPDNATALFADWAARRAAEPRLPSLRYSTFKSWGDAMLPAKARLPTIMGERPNLWWAENSATHHWMWSSYREAGRLLPAAESFAAFAALSAGGWEGYPAEVLAAAWLNVSLADHGISAEPTPKGQGLPAWLLAEGDPDTADALYAGKWAAAAAAGAALLGDAQAALAARVDASATAPAAALALLVVFNSLSWRRREPVLGLAPPPPLPGGGAVTLLAADGATPVPLQITAEGAMIFTADVPPLGLATYFLCGGATPGVVGSAGGEVIAPRPAAAAEGAAAPLPRPWTAPWSNPYFRLTPGEGGLREVVDVATNTSLFDTRFYDVGEWMELQYTGMGASETRAYAAPWVNASTFARLGRLGAPINWTVLEDGPVRSVFETAELQTAHSRVQLRVEAYAALPRLDVRVRILAWDSAFGVVNRVVFPIATDQRNVSFATPFGVVRVGVDEAEAGFHDMWLQAPGPAASAFERGWAMRPREVGDWVRAEGARSGGPGVTLSSSVGAFDWVDPTNAYPPEQPVLAPEMLMHTNSNRSPFLPEPGDHDFLFSISASAPGWASGWRAGVQPNNPLCGVQRPLNSSAPGARLPPSHSFVNISAAAGGEAEAWVTAVKKEDSGEGLILRAFAVSDRDDRVVVASAWPLTRGAARTDLIEGNAVDVPGTIGALSVELPLGHWAIETIKLGVM